MLKLDNICWLDIKFLTKRVDAAIDSHCKSCLLAVAPEPGERRVLAKALVAARQLTSGPTVTAQSKALSREWMTCCPRLNS